MNFQPLTLIIPEKTDAERDAMAAAWERAGGNVLRLGRFWDPPPVDAGAARLYGNDSFCMVLEQKLGLELVSPADDLLVHLPPAHLGRHVLTSTLADIGSHPFPAFVKSLIPKQIRSRIYADRPQLEAETAGLDTTASLIVSDPIDIIAEARSFILDGKVLDCSFYEGTADLQAARAFASSVATHTDLPRVVVLDVGLLRNGQWVVIELNPAWGAGLNGCDAELIIPAIAAATPIPRPG